MKTRWLTPLFLLPWLAQRPAQAGTVIHTNLPAGTSIVNIDATADGAASFNGDQSLWYQPFSTQGAADLLELPVAAGTYTFNVIDPADAAAKFPNLTPTQLGQVYTAWTFNSPWITDYLVFDLSAATHANESQLFDGAYGDLYGSAQDAYNGAVTSGKGGLLRLGAAGGRASAMSQNSYTFAVPTTLIFDLPDYYLPDNGGGVSVEVTAVPEPSAAGWLCLVGGGLAAVGGRRRFRRA